MINALDSFCGKEIYGCRFLGARLNMNPRTFSLCHEAQAGDRILGNIGNLTPESYYEALSQLVRDNMNEEAPCHKCDKGEKYIYTSVPINYVTVCTSEYCNSSCVYCQGHFGEKAVGYNPIPYLEAFHQEKLFSKNCYFDWGGGEPTLNPWFNATVGWLSNKGYWQRVNTNAILYSQDTELALVQGNAEVRISIDSGSKECFRFMKGHTGYDRVWEHVKDYCRVSDRVYIKYNVCNYNSDLEEIDLFLLNCKEYGVKNVIIDAEVNSYQPEKNAGPFYFTSKEFEAAHYLEKSAKEKGFHVEISGYAFSVRVEYDENGNIALPKKYFDNLDYEICSNGLMVQTFPSIRYMIEQILKQKEYPVAVWGARDMGRRCIQILKSYDIPIDNVIDNNQELENSYIYDIEVKSAKSYFLDHQDSQIILAGRRWKEMLKEVNCFQYCNKGLYYVPECQYYNWENIGEKDEN